MHASVGQMMMMTMMTMMTLRMILEMVLNGGLTGRERGRCRIRLFPEIQLSSVRYVDKPPLNHHVAVDADDDDDDDGNAVNVNARVNPMTVNTGVNMRHKGFAQQWRQGGDLMIHAWQII